MIYQILAIACLVVLLSGAAIALIVSTTLYYTRMFSDAWLFRIACSVFGFVVGSLAAQVLF